MNQPNDDSDPNQQNKVWRAKRAAKLLASLQIFATNIPNVADAIDDLYDLIDSDDEIEAAMDVLIEMEAALHATLFECELALSGIVGYDEPTPPDDMDGEDFEQSVLIDLGGLDAIDPATLFKARKQRGIEHFNRRGFFTKEQE